MAYIHLLWIIPLASASGFIIGILQSDTVQIGGKNNSITVDGKKIR